MLTRIAFTAALLGTLVEAIPAPQVISSGFPGGTAPGTGIPTSPRSNATSIAPSRTAANASVPVQYTSVVPPPPVVTSQVTGSTSHGPFSGTATTTGALSLSVQAPSIPALPPSPGETNGYPSDGQLHSPQPAPYTPAGGLGTNGSEPVYRVLSDFDFESLALALYQEYIELDVFHNGLATFSTAEFEAAGLTAEDRFLIEFMADQEVGHATLITNILGPAAAPKQCTYNYPFRTVREFVDFNQKLTRVGESGVYGFLNHLDSRPVGQLLLQSISTEARQQLIFRQFNGLFPMPVWFEVGIPQSWAWSLIAPYISSCPANQTRLAWQNFPALHVINQPNPARTNANQTGANETQGFTIQAPLNDAIVPSNSQCLNATGVGTNCDPAITHNRSIPLSYPGRIVQLQWDAPGRPTGPNNSYVTSTSAGAPSWVAWVNQLNVTYSPLSLTGNNTGTTIQPNASTYAGDPMINGTVFIALVDQPLALSPFNLSQINPHVVALTLYQAG